MEHNFRKGGPETQGQVGTDLKSPMTAYIFADCGRRMTLVALTDGWWTDGSMR